MKQINAGIIGLGRIGMVHLKNILTMPEVKIVQVADTFVDQKADELDKLGVNNRTSNYQDILNNPDIDTVFIFTSTDTHEKMVTEAAEAKKNIFCEKPLSMSTDEEKSLAVLRAVKKNGVKLQMGFNRRSDPQFDQIHQRVRNGEMGTPQVVKITSRDPEVTPHELIKRIGGLLFDFTMHDFDMARFMMGSDISEVYVNAGRLIDPGLAELNDYDTAVMTLKFANGTFGVIDNSRRAVYGYDQRVEVFGSKGMLKAENVSDSTVELYNDQIESKKKPLPAFPQRYKRAYYLEISKFVNSLLNGTPLAATGEDVVMAQRAAVAAMKSIETGLPQKVKTGFEL